VDLGQKLQIKLGSRVTLLAVPPGLDLELAAMVRKVDDPATADAVLAFVVNARDLDAVAAPALNAAREDRLAWIAYPKGGRLSTDLNRDRLAAAAGEHGVQPVRQVSIDDVWSALRFRPG
jgi:hypothetical protein